MSSLQATREAATTPRPRLRRRVRGSVLLLLCVFYALAYIDRGNISTAAPSIHIAARPSSGGRSARQAAGRGPATIPCRGSSSAPASRGYHSSGMSADTGPAET